MIGQVDGNLPLNPNRKASAVGGCFSVWVCNNNCNINIIDSKCNSNTIKFAVINLSWSNCRVISVSASASPVISKTLNQVSWDETSSATVSG